MTDPRHDQTLPRDPRFDEAWASVSDQTPPPALDAAILAAARREVGAGPRDARTAVAEATRPERWWFPLAAAATIGAIALGVLQVVGPDGVFGNGAPAVVSDLPPDTAAAGRPAPAPAPAPIAPPSSSAPPLIVGPGAPPPIPDRSPSQSAAPLPTAPADTVRSAPRPGLPSAAATTGKAQAPPRDPASPPAGAVAREASADAETDAARDAHPPALRFVPSPAPLPDRAPETATAPPAAGSSPPMSRERTSTLATAARLAAPPAERARGDAAPAAQLPGAPLPVPEWIALIRRLREEGRIDEAAKEIAAFRRAHPDHRLLLPPDLVDWRSDAR